MGCLLCLHTTSIGKKQYQEFVKYVLDVCSHSIHDPIHRNSPVIFRIHHRSVTSKHGKNIKVLQNYVSLFGQLYISMQSWQGDLTEFFAHEIQSSPPSLPDFGKLHLPKTKFGLIQCLKQLGHSELPSTNDCKVMDGAVIVHFLPTYQNQHLP